MQMYAYQTNSVANYVKRPEIADTLPIRVAAIIQPLKLAHIYN
jgi:hypothetical protein